MPSLSIGASLLYNFTNIDPLQMQQASQELESNGVLTDAGQSSQQALSFYSNESMGTNPSAGQSSTQGKDSANGSTVNLSA